MPARLTPQDDAILQYAVDRYLFTVSEVAEIAGRPAEKISRRFRMLGPNGRIRDGQRVAGLGFLKSTPQPFQKFAEDIWYPLQPAFDYALEQGWIQQPVRATDREHSTKLPHDMRVRDIRLALKSQFGNRLHWTQHYYNVHDRWGRGEDEHIFADSFFYIDRITPSPNYPSFFLELERTNEHSYDERGFSARVRKAESFLEYHRRGLFQEKFHYPDFRVIFVLRSARKARNFAEKLRNKSAELNSPKFWITDYDSLISGQPDIYITPRDYEHRRHSLNDT